MARHASSRWGGRFVIKRPLLTGLRDMQPVLAGMKAKVHKDGHATYRKVLKATNTIMRFIGMN